MELPERHSHIQIKLMKLAEQGTLTCTDAHQLAEAEGIPLMLIGKAAAAAGVKIVDCQLGCFGKYKER